MTRGAPKRGREVLAWSMHSHPGMHRPLWQILFTLTFVGFAMQRAVVAFALHDGAIPPVLYATFALQFACAILVALGLWFSRRWTVGALLALGVLYVCASLQTGFWLDLQPPAAALSEAIIVALATGALALALSHEFPHDGSERERTPTPRTRRSGRETRDDDVSRRDHGASRI